MAPKPIGIIISEISSTDDQCKINKLFKDNLREIFSHPKLDITNHLVHFNAKEVESLREFLLQQLCQTTVEKLQLELQAFGSHHDLESITLRKRYKDTGCHDDIYILGISIENSSLHKDFHKIIELNKKKKKKSVGAGAAEPQISREVPVAVPSDETKDGAAQDSISSVEKTPAVPIYVPIAEKEAVKKKNTDGSKKDTPATKTTNPQFPPMLHDKDATIIHHLTAIKNIVVALRDENKSLNQKINLLTTKVDEQTKEITLLKSGTKQNGAQTNATRVTHQLQQQQQRISQLQQQQQQRNSQLQQQQQSMQTSGDHMSPPSPPVPSLVSGAASTSPLMQPSAPVDSTQSNSTSAFEANTSSPTRTVPFETVRPKNSRQPVFGSKPRTEHSIAGQRVVREVSVFVGGVSNRLTEELLYKHLEEELLITPIRITHNKSNNYNQSFKVVVNCADKNVIFNPESWDENIILKPFKEKENRASNYSNNRSEGRYNRGVYQNWKNKPFQSRWDEQNGNLDANNGHRYDNMDNNMNSQYTDTHQNINLI